MDVITYHSGSQNKPNLRVYDVQISLTPILNFFNKNFLWMQKLIFLW